MASVMKKVKRNGLEPGLYSWGKAELTDKWVILHQKGLPKWAIYYKQSKPKVAVPCDLLSSKKYH